MMIDLINAARAERGLYPLVQSDQLGEAALGHARDLAAHPSMTANPHTGSNGSTIEQRIRATGYQPTQWGEVTGWGFQGDPAAMLQWWQNSQAHAPYIYATNVDEIGVGYTYAPGSVWGHYWTANTGKREGGPSPEPCPPTAPEKPPYTTHIPVVIASGGKGIDLLPYLRGDGRAYRVGNAWGSFEVFQSQSDRDKFYQCKAWDDLSVVNWEEFMVGLDTIGRDVDTSPGGGRYYRQFGAAWVKRVMGIGESFTQDKRIQFYRQTDCAPLSMHSGHVTDTITLIAHHTSYTFPANGWPPVTLEDVIQLRWQQGEDYFYAKNLGMVGWARVHQDANSPAWSAICEMRPDVGKLERLRIDCI